MEGNQLYIFGGMHCGDHSGEINFVSVGRSGGDAKIFFTHDGRRLAAHIERLTR